MMAFHAGCLGRYEGVFVFDDGAGAGAHSSVISAWSLLI